MEKINVWRIAIEDNKIVVYSEEGKRKEFPRDKWELFVEDVKQVQALRASAVYPTTPYVLVLPEEPYFCEVDEAHNRLFCGKEPEKVMIL